MMQSDPLDDATTMSGGGTTVLANRYRIVRQLGQGGMGSVWLAEDTTLDNRQVAIKMLPSVLVANKRAYRQLKAEALVSLKLTHSNIAALRSFEENGGNPFLVIDFIEGQSLDDYLADHGQLSEAETLRLLKPIAAALDYAHSRGVVHRDVKPSNVMIAKDGSPFILDFGIAREIQETLTRVTGKLSSGTLMYMSPEQLNGEAPTAAQDIYSFAAMVYECLAGHPPFCRGQIEHQILNNPPVPLPVNGPLARSVLSGLAKEPAARPNTCAELLERGTSSPSASNCTKARSPGLRRILAILAGLLLVVAGVVGGVKWYEERAAAAECEPHASSHHERVAVADERVAVADERQQHLQAAIAAFKRNDYERGMCEARQVGQIDDAELQFHVGYALANGKGTSRNLAAAVNLYRQAAEQGHAMAQLNLGWCYYNGAGVAKDVKEAVKWYRLAAEQGCAEAQYELAGCCQFGLGVPSHDDYEATKWYRQAAERGHAQAQNALGGRYRSGLGVEKDDSEAVRWFQQAAGQGDVNAQYNLAGCYATGEGVRRSVTEAVRWFRQAAEQGHAKAQYNLGWYYESGEGVKRDSQTAVSWYRKAAEKGNADAKRRLREMGYDE